MDFSKLNPKHPVWKKSNGKYWIQYLPILFFHTGSLNIDLFITNYLSRSIICGS